jgi:SAM-dependent methyltransferase
LPRTISKFINSYLTPRTWSYRLSKSREPIGLLFQKRLISREFGRPKSLVRNVEIYFYKTISHYLFMPTSIEFLIWYLRDGLDEVKRPSDFNEIDERSTTYLDLIEKHTALDFHILDVGCNCGRHLSALFKRGYRKFTGVDISKNALTLMGEWYPDLIPCATLNHATFEEFFTRQEDLSYDCTITYGATIENVNPVFDIVGHMCRVSKKNVIVNINIDGHAFPRFWIKEFERNGFMLVERTQCMGKGVAIPTLVFKRV